MNSGRESPDGEDRESPVEVKKEPAENEDIKDYAANTMNELLAIYGYDETVDKSVTEDLQLQNFSEDKQGRKMRKGGKRKSSRLSLQKEHQGGTDEDGASTSGSSVDSATGGSELMAARGQLFTAIQSAADLEQRSSSFPEQIICAWCQQLGLKRYTLNTATESKAFCSEKCFASCRRAYFKRNKVCDWCRHIRHTKEYVDFQSGDAKLQFCSEKCLNQYKMDVFCKETKSLGTGRDYQVDCNKVPSPLPAGVVTETVTVVSPVTTNKKGKKSSILKSSMEFKSRDIAESSGSISPIPSTAGASNGTVRQIQNLLQNRSSKVQQADSTVTSSPLSIPNLLGGSPPQAAINAAASVQAAAALQQSTFLGAPALFQSPLGASHGGPFLGQTPLVFGGNPLLQQQDIGLNSQPSQFAAPNLPTSPFSLQGAFAPLGTNPSAKASKSQNEQPPKEPTATPSSVLPPLTIIVPHPIFVPIPIPIPVPIPIRAEAYDAAKRAADMYDAAKRAAEVYNAAKTAAEAQKESPKQESGHKFVVANGRNPFLEQDDDGKSKSLFNLSTIDNLPQEHQNQSVLHHRVRILKEGLLKKPGNSSKNSPNLFIPSFPASNGLQRSASLDLSLASRPSSSKSSLHRHSHKVRTQLVMVGEDPSAIHDGRESSRKVREVLRVHLNKRISQSALNLAEIGHSSSDGQLLRRSHSLSRLRESSISSNTSCADVGNKEIAGSKEKSANKKTRRVLDKRNRIEEDIEMERELMINEEGATDETEEDEGDERGEPSCKRKKWTNDVDDSS